MTAGARALIPLDFATITEKERPDAQVAETPVNAGAGDPSSRFRCVDQNQIVREPAVVLGKRSDGEAVAPKTHKCRSMPPSFVQKAEGTVITGAIDGVTRSCAARSARCGD